MQSSISHNISPSVKIIFSYITVFLPLIGVFAAIYWWSYMEGIDIFLFVVMYILAGLGITVGFHRYFTHNAFKCKKWLRHVFLILGSMAGEGTLLYWVSTHRSHHRLSDEEGDPHSPNLTQNSWFGRIKGFCYAHVGWILDNKQDIPQTYVADLLRDKHLLKMDYAYLAWVSLGFIIPGVIAGLWTQSWMGAWMGVVWGGFVRMFAVHHTTWAVNSICHVFGTRTYPTRDKSRDNWLFGILALGEGWHNSHHAFPTSARHGLKWWQLDISYLVIKLLATFGMVWDVKLPQKTFRLTSE